MDSNAESQDYDVQELARKLASRNAHEHTNAESVAKSVAPEVRAALLRQLVNDYRAANLIGCTASGIIVLVATFISLCFGILTLRPLYLVTTLFMPLLALPLLDLGPRNRIKNALASVIAPIGHGRGTMTLLLDVCGILRFSDTLCDAMEQAVVGLDIDERELITSGQLEAITYSVTRVWIDAYSIQQMTHARQVRWIRRAMVNVKVLSKLGSASELTRIEKYAERKTKYSWQKQIQDVLVEELPAWKARLADEAGPQNLLRSSSAPEGTDVLLRATAKPEPVKTSEMLRADINRKNQ